MSGKLGHEFLVGIGCFPTQLMIEVHDRENDAELLAEFEEQTKQGDGIGSAGNRYADSLSGSY